MMKQFIIAAVLLMAVALSGVAAASDLATVRALLDAGDYDAAAEQAGLIPTADGKALAAEALLSEIMLGEVEKNKKQAKQARQLTEEALALDPSHQNARLQHAIADGFVTREASDVSAWMKKLPQKTQAVIQAYRSDFPLDVRGDALMGAWHLAIVRKTGTKNAQNWFGANISDGRAYFDKASAFEPDDIIIGVNYAFALIALDDEDMPDTDFARAILMHLTAMEPRDHLNKTVLNYGREAVLRLEDREAARDYVGMFLDGEKPE